MPRPGPGERTPGSGRKPGQVNHLTRQLKDLVRQALDECGGVEYLKIQASENPVAFLSLCARLLPSELSAKISGSDGGPVRVQVIRCTDAPGTLPMPQDEPGE